ncbi:MAG: hypothetical protein ABJB39_01940 [Chloroflexota bacterium]
MNETETTPAPAAGGRQVGQSLAGRYRLAMFKGGDDLADVWHALDDQTEKVVTLEILRDRDNEAARQRFLAEARRMAAIERPSVMRVAAIHDDTTATFIVFEHLIPLPVVLTELSAIAKDVKPATKAAASTLSAVVGPTRSASSVDAVSAASNDVPVEPTYAVVDLDAPDELVVAPDFAMTAPLPEAPQSVSGTFASAKPDVSDIAARVKSRVAADARLLASDLKLDGIVDDLRAVLPKGVGLSRVAALAASVTARARDLAGGLTSLRAPSIRTGTPSARVAQPATPRSARPGVSLPSIRLPRPSIGLPNLTLPGIALPRPNVGSLASGVASRALPLLDRARGNRFVLGGAVLVILAAVVIVSPLDDAITSVISRPAANPTATPRSALAPAPFEVPPLSAYGAAFESQGAYPTSAPNGNVEWVVALRNTGSAGWYRGIEGAQAALAMPDGAGVAVQSTEYVGPGQVGWFVVHFRARAETGTYTVQLVPRIDGRGPLQDLGIFTVVTVAKNP